MVLHVTCTKISDLGVHITKGKRNWCLVVETSLMFVDQSLVLFNLLQQAFEDLSLKQFCRGSTLTTESDLVERKL